MELELIKLPAKVIKAANMAVTKASEQAITMVTTNSVEDGAATTDINRV